MTESEYENFMVFELLNSGERQRLDTNETDLRTILDPEQVFVIVKEEIRRIYIWKGGKSAVRKRFISSRVASKLQEELVKEAAFHRCKIVSVDQGDEPEEFLKSFNLTSMEVTERLADMRYVRNIDKDPSTLRGRVVESTAGVPSAEAQEYYSPALEELKKSGEGIIQKSIYQTKSPLSYRSPIRINPKQIIDKMIKIKLPEGYQRQNLIINQDLYGEILKETNVFGQRIEEKVWEKISKLPQGVYELENYRVRIYFYSYEGLVKGIEILKYENNSIANSTIQKTSIELPDNDKPIKEKILEIQLPKNYKRQNLIVDQNLYGTVSKKGEVFGEEQKEVEWALVEKVPKEIISLKNHLFRIYFNKKEKTVEAVEILKRSDSEDSQKNLTKKEISSQEKKRRELPKIPIKED